MASSAMPAGLQWRRAALAMLAMTYLANSCDAAAAQASPFIVILGVSIATYTLKLGPSLVNFAA